MSLTFKTKMIEKKDARDLLLEELVTKLPKNPHGRLLLAPRSAKTRIMIELIKRDNPNSVLWITPSRKLANEDIYSEFDKWNASSYKNRVKTNTYRSLEKESGYFDWIILDEEQALTELNSENLLCGKLKYGNIISMTGTNTKHYHKNKIYDALNLNVLHTVTINQAVNEEILSDYLPFVVSCDLNRSKDIKIEYKNGSFYSSEYDQYMFHHNRTENAISIGSSAVKKFSMARLNAIKNSPTKIRVAKKLLSKVTGRTIIFCPTIKIAQELCKNTYHSKTNDKDLKKFINQKIDIISMVNSGGTGYTYNNVKNLIIMQADSDSNGLTSQKVCRALLKEDGKIPNVIFIMLNNTKDVVWVEKALQRFDSSKINYIKEEEL